MTKLTRFAVALGILFIVAFLVILAIASSGDGGNLSSIFVVILVMGALVLLIGAGNLTYGKNSHYAKAWARIRPARSRPAEDEDWAPADRHHETPTP
jgi:hypothetical protein